MIDEAEEGEPGEEYAWLIETSDDGKVWSRESHPVHQVRNSGGIERALTTESLAQRVLARRFASLLGDNHYDWDELWFRATVWRVDAAATGDGPLQTPAAAGPGRVAAETYGHYLQVRQIEPHAVEVCTPGQVHAAAWQRPIGAP